MPINAEARTHLDHLIKRQNIRYVPAAKAGLESSLVDNWSEPAAQEDRTLRYDDIRRDDCAEFLDSVIHGRIIPSIILWKNRESSFIYVLDGAHRLSVIRAWMIDDWGDKAGDHYARRDEELIRITADKTRALVKARIGNFAEFQQAFRQHSTLSDQGLAPRKHMEARHYDQASFYSKLMGSLQTLSVQWERGDYESAEQSFLRINRRGQVLDPWEANLIEHRGGSYARCIMSIANGGESGHYWPPLSAEDGDESLVDLVRGFSGKASGIHNLLFVPRFQVPITNLNVPMMVAPAYFQKHKYLLEIAPLIVDREIASSEDHQLRRLRSDASSPAEVVIRNAERILDTMERNLDHLVSMSHSSRSLSIVPLFYWYNQQAQYARGIFYGFIYWLLCGSEEDIMSRKLLFSAHRDRFEGLLFIHKQDIATLQEKGGAGLYAARRVAEFFQVFLQLLVDNPEWNLGSSELELAFNAILRERARVTNRSRPAKTSRSYSVADKSQINIRELFSSAIRCHICGGVVNIHYGGLQYDHVDDYARTNLTDPDTGKPTHPFCNRHKRQIQELRGGIVSRALPPLRTSEDRPRRRAKDTRQMSLDDFWGTPDFPV